MPLQEPVLPGVLESNYSAVEGRGWRDQYLTNKLMNDEFLFQASTSEVLGVLPTADIEVHLRHIQKYCRD